LLPVCADCLEILGTSISWNPRGLFRSLRSFTPVFWNYSDRRQDFDKNGNALRGRLKGELNVAFEIPIVFDFIRKQCRQKAEVTRNVRKEMCGTLDKAETRQNA
jgi:hypothetical protein